MGEEEAEVRDKLKDIDTETKRVGDCICIYEVVFVNCVSLE